MRAVLAAGAKSPSHLNVALERYAAALGVLLNAVGHEQGEPLLVGLAAEFYVQLPQKVRLRCRPHCWSSLVLEDCVIFGSCMWWPVMWRAWVVCTRAHVRVAIQIAAVTLLHGTLDTLLSNQSVTLKSAKH